MLTEPIKSLHEMLRLKPALIIHFSGCPKGVGRDLYYPENLMSALTNPQEILSCSAVTQATVFGATGSVGVVIGPVDEEGGICVSHEDIGAGPSTAQRKELDRPTSVDDCKKSLDLGGSTNYNEWLIGPYRVIGLFVAPGAHCHIPSEDPEEQYKNIDAAEVRKNLGRHRIFSIGDTNFIELQPDKSWKYLDMSTLYP